MTTKRSVELEAASAIGGIVKAGIKKASTFKKSATKGAGKEKKEKSREKAPKSTESPKKNPSPAKVETPSPKRSKAITKGPNATHAISADTGKPVKLKAEQREAVRAYETKPATKYSTPAVNLEDTFTPRQFSVTDKRSSAS
jgi:hypothetical protein